MAWFAALRRARAPRPGPDRRRRALLVGAAAAVGAGVTGVAAAAPARRDAPGATGGSVLDVRSLGAAGDGRTDDGDAIRRGLDQVNARGGTLYFPAGTYYYRATGALRPAAGVALTGDPGASTILFDRPGAQGFVEFCAVEADGVTLDGLVVRRAAEFPAVLVSLGAVAGCTVSRCALLGDREAFPGADCHGIKIAESGTAATVAISDSTLATLSYGLLQTNASTAVVEGITVARCTFTRNGATDLEFNSPAGSVRQIRVENCCFSANAADGFGVGLAHVTGAVLTANTFDGYALEAVHVEDYSQDVTVTGNDFTSCGLREDAHVQIIGGSRDVLVQGNTFHAAMNTARIYLVNALPGGTEPTPGGRPAAPPAAVTVTGNTFDCAPAVAPVYFEGVAGGSITGNRITGSALGGPGDAFRLLTDPGTAVAGNTVNGRVY